jgi:hypothetical protein
MNSVFFIFSNRNASRGASICASQATPPFVNRQSKIVVRHSLVSCFTADLIEFDIAASEVPNDSNGGAI